MELNSETRSTWGKENDVLKLDIDQNHISHGQLELKKFLDKVGLVNTIKNLVI